MVDREKRQFPRQGDRLSRHHPDDDAADQAGPPRGGDPRQIVEADPGLPEGVGDQLVQMVEMRAGGDFRHDAAIGLVQADLAQDQVRPDAPVGIDDRGGGFVAACLDSEH